jgi:hypothetical protein
MSRVPGASAVSQFPQKATLLLVVDLPSTIALTEAQASVRRDPRQVCQPVQ